MSIAMTDIPRDLHDLYRDAPKNADAIQAVAWLRKTVRTQAANEAALEALNESDNPAYTETLMLVCSLADHMQWPISWANAALQAEWKQAQEKAKITLEAAEKAARRLVFERATGQRVLEAAMLQFERAGYAPPRDAVVALCRRIAQGGSRGLRRG
jgi:hypothetical protein